MYPQLYIARRERREKQRDVAKMLGISMQSYHMKECGKSDFNMREAKMLAIHFGCSLDNLFGEN